MQNLVSKQFLYHKIPDDMTGTVLYPLNQLKNIYPDLYDKKASKYAGREKVMEWKIPGLDCLWNDVLHFDAIGPQEIKQALKEAGSKTQNKWKCFRIDPHLLNPENSVIYLNKIRGMGEKLPEDFLPFDPDNLSEYSILSEEAREYYKEMYAENKIPLVHGKIVHILYKGSLDINNCEIVE